MRWLGVTVALLTASVCLAAWIFLRDRDTSEVRLTEAQTVLADTPIALRASGVDCRAGCTLEMLRHTGGQRWLMRVTIGGEPRCLQIDLNTFSIDARRSLSRVEPSRCTDALLPSDAIERTRL